MTDLSLYSHRTWVNDQLQPASLRIRGDRITAVEIGKKIPGAIDYGEAVIMPGVIDAHVHINEPGRTNWEGFDTATRAAAAGGITTLVDMPLNSSPVVTTVAAFDKKVEAAKGQLHVNCGFWAGAVNSDTHQLKALLEAGCLGVKVFLSHSGIDEFPNISLDDLGKVMAAMAAYNKPLLAHCELDHLPATDAINAAPRSYAAYLASRPNAWENEAIKTFVALGEQHHCTIHIVHLSATDLVPWLAAKKKIFPKLTVETCPHYLTFIAEDIADGNTLLKCAPPIRNRENNEELKKAVADGVIDFIASDHSPALPSLKGIDHGRFDQAWGGIAGLQWLLPASWSALKTTIKLEEFIPLLTSRPATFLGVNDEVGIIAPGYRADLTVWRPEKLLTVQTRHVQHRHKITPYLGMQLSGEVISTFVNGMPVWKNGMLQNQNEGRILLRESS